MGGTAPGCSQQSKMRTLFPEAKKVGLAKRSAVKSEPAREPIFPGRCGPSWWTEYSGPKGYSDISVTLYAKPGQVGAPLAEPLFGAVHRQSNGARVRMTPAGSIGPTVVSAYRNVFISSNSTDGSLSVAGQLRLHRAIEAALDALHGLR